MLFPGNRHKHHAVLIGRMIAWSHIGAQQNLGIGVYKTVGAF
jgi:hypothetical protein